MSPTGGATTVDYDGKGRIWSSAPDGALSFDPETEKFTEYKSMTYKTPNGNGVTYGMAADRDGNGWWAEMTSTSSARATSRPASRRMKLAPVKENVDSQARRPQVLRNLRSPTSTTRCPGRRVRAGWAPTRPPTYSGSAIHGAPISRASIPARTRPHRATPGAAAALSHHRRQQAQRLDQHLGAGRVLRYNPQTAKWTTFDLPTRGAEPRYISLLEKDGGRCRSSCLIPRAQGRGHDLPQRGRFAGPQGRGGAPITEAVRLISAAVALTHHPSALMAGG